ncbi:uncharacterized protein LOC135814012 [Sycon ciliatum]|uniref:uncharacterized protein LOC135814012 n=1 Tax=Sycon ciliatum TaxID=27933 RepID=UPI0031F649DE
MLCRLSSLPHPGLHQVRCCSVRSPKVVGQARPQATNDDKTSDQLVPQQASPSSNSNPRVVNSPKTVGQSSSYGRPSINSSSASSARYGAVNGTFAGGYGQHQAGGTVPAPRTMTTTQAPLPAAAANTPGMQQSNPDLNSLLGLSGKAPIQDYLPQLNPSEKAEVGASIMYKLQNAESRTALMTLYLNAFDRGVDDMPMLLLVAKRLRSVEAGKRMSDIACFERFCNAVSCSKHLFKIPPNELLIVFRNMRTMGAFENSVIASRLIAAVLHVLPNISQAFLLTLLKTLAHPQTKLPPEHRDRALAMVSMHVRQNVDIFDMTDGGERYADVVKHLIVPCILITESFLQKFLSTLLRSASLLRPEAVFSLIQSLHGVGTPFADQALMIVAAVLATHASNPEWRKAVDAAKSRNIKLPAVLVDVKALLSQSGPELLAELSKSRPQALSTTDARHVLLAMRSHVADFSVSDIANIRAVLISNAMYSCLYEVVGDIVLESIKSISLPAMIAFLELFSESVELPRVASAGRVHFLAAMESLDDAALCRSFTTLCKADLWSVGCVERVCKAVAASQFSESSDGGEQFITSMATIHCTDVALMEALTKDYVLPRVITSKTVSADLLCSLALLNVESAEEVFDMLAVGEVEVTLPGGAEMTGASALRVLHACQLYGVYPQALVELFLSSIGDAAIGKEYGKDFLSDAASLFVSLQQQDRIVVDLATAGDSLARFYPTFEKECLKYMSKPGDRVTQIRHALQVQLKNEELVNLESFSRCGDFFAAALMYDHHALRFIPCRQHGVLNPESLMERNVASSADARHVAVVVDAPGAIARNVDHGLGRSTQLYRRLSLLGWSVIRVKESQCETVRQTNAIVSRLLAKFISESYRHTAQETVHIEESSEKVKPLSPMKAEHDLKRPSLDALDRHELVTHNTTLKNKQFVSLKKFMLQTSLSRPWKY